MTRASICLVDENVLINASRDIYPPDRIPEFWRWLRHWVDKGRVRTLKRITKRLKHDAQPGKPEDELSRWIRNHERELCVEHPHKDAVDRVLRDGYEVTSLADMSRGDPNDVFLIAAALAAPGKRVVVTMEDPHRRAKKGRKRRIPYVCDRLGVKRASLFRMLRELDFRTSDWRGP